MAVSGTNPTPSAINFCHLLEVIPLAEELRNSPSVFRQGEFD